MKAVQAAFAAATTERDRLWVLAQAADNGAVATVDLGFFCHEVGATADHLGRLLLHRAAKQGLRPRGDLIR